MKLRYLLNDLVEKFDVSEQSIEELDYQVGNTSGIDVGEVPSDLAERVGNLAQRGGSIMEIKAENPASFRIDREDLYNIINRLGLDTSFHGDPNVGYTSAYRSSQGRGFKPTHEHFTKYLQELASFKQEKNARGLDFDVRRINPHISTDPRPALEERMAQDVSVDPFGIPSGDFSDEAFRKRQEKKADIWANKEFLKTLYYTLYKRESQFAFQFFSSFAGYSESFDTIWKQVRHQAIWKILQEETEGLPQKEKVREFILLSQTVTVSDQAVEGNWDKIVAQQELEHPLTYMTINQDTGEPEDQEEELLGDLEDPLSGDNPLSSPLGLRSIDSLLRNLEENSMTFEEDDADQVILNALDEALMKLWGAPDLRGGEEAFISVEGKLTGLERRLDVQQLRVVEMAYRIGQRERYEVNGYSGLDIDQVAARVFAGEEEFFDERDNRSIDELHRGLLKRVLEGQRFERLLRMESNLLYEILPAWMKNSDTEWSFEGEEVHRSYEAPRFLWETVVERRWDIDFRDPESDNYYFRLLENNPEFRRDVAAASSALYVWGHFTQIDSRFEMGSSRNTGGDEGVYTWVEWMKKYEIGVNFEAMAGGSNQEFKIWRPKDIVAACHAVNLTARRQEGGFPGLDDAPLKFTIDMEHTATFGVEPWNEMELLAEQENWLHKNKEEKGWDVKTREGLPFAEMVNQYHLTKPGLENSQGAGHLHGGFRFGDKELYTWIYKLVENGFAKGDETAVVMYEVGGEKVGTVMKAKLSMNMVEIGLKPEEVDPSRVDPNSEYENEEEALIARFFRMDRPNYSREWAKIEEHAFDPLKGLLEATEFDYTSTSSAAIKRDNRPGEFQGEEYR